MLHVLNNNEIGSMEEKAAALQGSGQAKSFETATLKRLRESYMFE